MWKNIRVLATLKASHLLLLLNLTLTLIAFSVVFNNYRAWVLFAFSYETLLRGYYWTPLTSMFTHGNVFHLTSNMIYLYVFGHALEREIGAKKTVETYLIGGLSALFISPIFYGYKSSLIGSSAAISALAGYLVLVKPWKFSYALLMPYGIAIGSFLFINTAASLMFFFDPAFTYAFGGVATIAHLIGLFYGFFRGILSLKQISWLRVGLALALGSAYGFLQVYLLLF